MGVRKDAVGRSLIRHHYVCMLECPYTQALTATFPALTEGENMQVTLAGSPGNRASCMQAAIC